MSALRSWLMPITLMVVAGACGSDSGGPSGASGIAVQSGNGQSAHINASPAQPLVVLVTGSGGGPFQGATVTWSVTSGSATVSPTSSSSDPSGLASAVVTFGPTAGAV